MLPVLHAVRAVPTGEAVVTGKVNKLFRLLTSVFHIGTLHVAVDLSID